MDVYICYGCCIVEGWEIEEYICVWDEVGVGWMLNCKNNYSLLYFIKEVIGIDLNFCGVVIEIVMYMRWVYDIFYWDFKVFNVGGVRIDCFKYFFEDCGSWFWMFNGYSGYGILEGIGNILIIEVVMLYVRFISKDVYSFGMLCYGLDSV